MKKTMPLKTVFGLHGQVVFQSGKDSPASRLAPFNVKTGYVDRSDPWETERT